MQDKSPKHEITTPNYDDYVIDPYQAIIDPHIHLWNFGSSASMPPFLLEECANTISKSGHNITKTVFVECNTMYRHKGPEHFKSVGETEFAVGMAAMSESGLYGNCQIAAGIVANVDLQLGEKTDEVIAAHSSASNGRLRGIRCQTAYAKEGLFQKSAAPELANRMLTTNYAKGVKKVHAHGLSLDVWCVYSQLNDLIEVADRCPNGLIILNHLGSPFNFEQQTKREEVLNIWRHGIEKLAQRPNIFVKLGGIGMNVGKQFKRGEGTIKTEELAANWRLFIEHCIDKFGPERCMFESNFPVDRGTCSYRTLWNTFKLISINYSKKEKSALFYETARRAYKL
ncbi:amidohydrolase family protein [Halioxenophilus aromaticivorans]|uniref:Amidohydrolase family protein n=1 Tax=Halioxenophilus aromaticivorans TaxID=1306992 RepID=A0AAV3U5E7_9ALTE